MRNATTIELTDGFINLPSRNWRRHGDRSSWIRFDAATRRLTVCYGKGVMSDEYYAELVEFCGRYGIDFTALHTGERASVIVPEEQPAEAEQTAEAEEQAGEQASAGDDAEIIPLVKAVKDLYARGARGAILRSWRGKASYVWTLEDLYSKGFREEPEDDVKEFVIREDGLYAPDERGELVRRYEIYPSMADFYVVRDKEVKALRERYEASRS